MTPFECNAALSDLCAAFGLGADARAAWCALVYKACTRMEPEHFKAVCEDLLREAGSFKPTNQQFWESHRRLAQELGWAKSKRCSACGTEGGHKAIGGVWLVRDGWRTAAPFPETATEVFQDGSRPCPQDESNAAVEWRKSFYAATSRGWTEMTIEQYGAELRSWQAERARRRNEEAAVGDPHARQGSPSTQEATA